MAEHEFNHKRRQFITQSAGIVGAAGFALSTATLAETKAEKAAENATENRVAKKKDRYGIKGEQAPEIKLDYWIDKDGKPAEFSVLENRGKWVFLKCFQDWCPGCHASGFPALKAFADEFWDHPQVAIAGIQTVFEGFGANLKSDVRKLQLRYDLPITMGHDQGDPRGDRFPKTVRNYFTGGTPWLILIEPGGMVVFNNFHVDSTKLIEFMKIQLKTA